MISYMAFITRPSLPTHRAHLVLVLSPQACFAARVHFSMSPLNKRVSSPKTSEFIPEIILEHKSELLNIEPGYCVAQVTSASSMLHITNNFHINTHKYPRFNLPTGTRLFYPSQTVRKDTMFCNFSH